MKAWAFAFSLHTHTNPHQHEAALWELSRWEEIAQKRSNCILHAIKVVKNCGSRWLKYFSQYAFATQIPTLHALAFPSHGTLLFLFWWCEENQFCALPKRSREWQKITEKTVELLLGRIFLWFHFCSCCYRTCLYKLGACRERSGRILSAENYKNKKINSFMYRMAGGRHLFFSLCFVFGDVMMRSTAAVLQLSSAEVKVIKRIWFSLFWILLHS